ncbi:trna-dihydrouridine(47) synthase [Acrodontium crateriforme]|uniref:tRNA-dihydrouridine(47) synthase [NAD(P)(+)] n=1 Tax=Acrodontium crateriforme TaxID=150365 RepID=A0AAQ3ME57_9PEZI|nr:trna-dihydrouridine(47) synthase [Acrodontium crateriforme]
MVVTTESVEEPVADLSNGAAFTDGVTTSEPPATAPQTSKSEAHARPADGDESAERAFKRAKIDHDDSNTNSVATDDRKKGVAPIKAEYLVDVKTLSAPAEQADDDDAEAKGKSYEPAAGRGGKKTKGGQNTTRQFGSSRDAIGLCKSRTTANEFDPQTCKFGDKCRFTHDIRLYLKDGKREDLTTFGGGICPVWELKGKCNAGWSCRLASSHSKEVEHEDGRKELQQIIKSGNASKPIGEDEEDSTGVLNVTTHGDKITLRKKKFPLPKSDEYLKWLDSTTQQEGVKKTDQSNGDATNDNRARYVEPPFRASEKRRLYYGPETPVLAPLTTQGNLPYRRLCVSLGAQITWSEMAMGMPLVQGEKSEWALMKAHESEGMAPNYSPKNIVHDYDNSKDLRFGAQIAANKPWLALKTTEILTALCPSLRAIDLNCGCPIELVCRQGAGSALLDSHGKLEKTLRGMNAVSGEVPITVKIRMGTKDKQPTAEKLCEKLILGGSEAQEFGQEPCGVAAITLHGRSKQQRYTRSADWEYIAECATLVKSLQAKRDVVSDTVREPDARDLPVNTKSNGLPYFCGNGDILSHVDYNEHMANAGVDSCMIGRGALIKPWIFEEIAANQYLDKSASERLAYIEQFARNGLEYWGSDEIGVGTTRRFLLEWLSFSCRYVPIGILEHLPPRLGDRPPAFRGRSELETLLCSSNYKDWIKISEMFLGPAHKDFNFQPKHKSNSYEIEAEG